MFHCIWVNSFIRYKRVAKTASKYLQEFLQQNQVYAQRSMHCFRIQSGTGQEMHKEGFKNHKKTPTTWAKFSFHYYPQVDGTPAAEQTQTDSFNPQVVRLLNNHSHHWRTGVWLRDTTALCSLTNCWELLRLHTALHPECHNCTKQTMHRIHFLTVFLPILIL